MDSESSTLLAEASRLWAETGLTPTQIAQRLGISRNYFCNMRRRHRGLFRQPREFLAGDPTPEELERLKAEVLNRRREAGKRTLDDPPPDYSGETRVGNLRYYMLADRRRMAFRQGAP